MQCLIRLARSAPGPAKPLAVLLVMGLLLLTVCPGVAYGANIWKDITDAQWQDIYRVSAQDAYRVAQGYADGTFRPNQPVTRGQFAKMVVDGLGIPPADPTTPTFSDVPRGSTFYTYVEGAYKAGIISGYMDGTFKPDTNLLRQQGYSILGKYLAGVELQATGVIKDGSNTYASLQAWYNGVGAANLNGYADSNQIDTVHKPATAYLIHMEVVLGSSSGGLWYLSPQAQLNRAPAVAMILRTETKVLDLTKPSITGIAPTAGPLGGGNTVVITGKGFVGVSAVKFGAVAAISYTVDSGTQITAVAPPSASAGTVSISVTAQGGTSPDTSADNYTYVAGPTVTAINPAAGPPAGGTLVTITGTNFADVGTVTFGGTPALYTVVSPTQISAQSPPHAAGVVDVRVTTAGGTSPNTDADNFTYVNPPTLVSLDPTTGLTTGGNSVVITGTNFVGVTGVSFGGTPAATFTVDSSVQVTATAPPHAAGDVVVRVTAAGGTTSAGEENAVYTYVAAPTITAIQPPAGPIDGGIPVKIVGNNLGAVNLVAFGDRTVTPTLVEDHTVTVTVPAYLGLPADQSVNVTLYTPLGSVVFPGAFQYLLPPVLTSVDPTSGPTAGGTQVALRGFHFFHATEVFFGADPATMVSVSADGRTLTVTAPAGDAGKVDVKIVTPAGEATLPDAYEYMAVM